MTMASPPNEEESPFILSFIEYLESFGWDVKVCLPNSQKSWISKSFMIKDSIEVSYYNRKTRQINHHQSSPSDFVLLSGTPATCVNIALYHIFKDESFDLVLAGPNFGRNSSTIYTLASGTIGAAMEAVLCDQKAIALSYSFYSRDFSKSKIDHACEMAFKVINHLCILDEWPKNGLFNVNVPLVEEECPVHLTTFAQASYGSLFKPIGLPAANVVEGSENVEQQVRMEGEGESGRQVFRFLPDYKTLSISKTLEPGTDAWALENRFISVTPMLASFELAKQPNVNYRFESLNKL
ncbi:survival protein sure-like phosphatase/nucleotidase [Phycomyces blakesleeanus]|uniref:Survival protein sure-like phosphatase/nucleotidase n=1 Tax=Phycomyces blakesleeanus TaxID=4837 RepID=A0ABR3B5J1_PHYBL